MIITSLCNVEETITQEIEESLKPVDEITEEVKEIEKSKESLDKILSQPEDAAKKAIEKEIKKAEDLKKKIDKIITTKEVKPQNVTNWWNGMGYDF